MPAPSPRPTPRRLALLLTAVIACTAHATPPPTRDPGVTLRIWHLDREPQSLPTLAPDQTPNLDLLLPTIDFRADLGFGDAAAPFVATVSGWIDVPTDGLYRFRLTSDDGSTLDLDDARLIDNDGRHSARPRESEPISLTKGSHPFRIDHFDGGGSRVLRLEWTTPEGPEQYVLIPAEALSTHRDLTRVTSPGPKRLADGLRPGDGLPVAGVHPSWQLSTIRPKGFEPMVGAMAFLPDGRLVVGTFNPLQRDERDLPDIESKEPDKLYALRNVTSGDPAKISVEVIADGLYEPAGLCPVGGDLYVSHRREITRLRDTNGDGSFDTHTQVASGWEAWNYHQFTRGLIHRDGKLYAALTTAMGPPAWEGMGTNAAPNGPLRGSILEIDIESGSVRSIAGGMRTPNGLGLGPRPELVPGEFAGAERILFYSDNQGTWMPTSQLSEVIPGRFFGHFNRTNVVPKLAERYPTGGYPSMLSDRQRTPASLLLPQNEVVNSPTDVIPIDDGPFAGQVFLGELTGGGIRRVFLERVNGQLQGALFRFTQGLECGVNTLVRGPDGAIYIGGIGAGGNWNWRETRFGLQRLAPTDRITFEIQSLSIRHDGFLLRFTKPVDAAWRAEPSNYRFSQWTYTPTAEYGGPKVGLETLTVRAAIPEDDGRSVRLHVDGLNVGHCVHLRTDPVSLDGEAIWSTEAWYTINAIPARESRSSATIAGVAIDSRRSEFAGVGVGVLPPSGAVPLISGGPSNVMRFDGRKETPAALTAGELVTAAGFVEVGNGSGDLVSTTSFGDARLHIEWYCPPGGTGQMAGNSGVYLQERYEVQVLGTLAGAAPQINEAGAIYGVRPPDRNASTGPGTWQAYDIWFRAPRFVEGVKREDARMTIYWNGVLVHNDVAIPGPTGAAARGGEATDRANQIGALRFQDHASAAEGPVRYRNVWIAPLEGTNGSVATDPADPADGRPRGTSRPWRNLLQDSVTTWVPRGGQAEFRVEHGLNGREIVGTTRPSTPNTFLVTTERFDDFELLFEVKADPRLNSGVQIRSEVVGGIDNRDGGLRGLQVEIDSTTRAYSGGLYDEQRRGWLHPLHASPASRGAFRPGEWNTFHVIARGPVIETWINGVPVASLFDATDPSGHIALQVHSVGDQSEPMEVRFRDLRIR